MEEICGVYSVYTIKYTLSHVYICSTVCYILVCATLSFCQYRIVFYILLFPERGELPWRSHVDRGTLIVTIVLFVPSAL